jgi:uncharacterized glyoxalase superfamily protein PhnB
VTEGFRLGLRVPDVHAAAAFYGGLGFDEEGVLRNEEGEAVLAILERAGATLVVDALEGLPFPDSERDQLVRRGPRGLGLVIGVEVDDLDEAYEYCTKTGCEITCEPMDEPWGERLFTFLDPFGYEWKLAVPLPVHEHEQGLAATQDAWFGS